MSSGVIGARHSQAIGASTSGFIASYTPLRSLLCEECLAPLQTIREEAGGAVGLQPTWTLWVTRLSAALGLARSFAYNDDVRAKLADIYPSLFPRSTTMHLHGILPACVTPFIDGRADPAAMQTNLARWLDAGVHGVLIFGSTGEFVYLEDEERSQLLKAARAVVPQDRLLLVGCGAESTPRTLRLLRAAAEHGADAALVITPVYYTRGDTDAQRLYFDTVAESSPLPVLLYNVAAFTAYDLPVNAILDLAHHPNIVGIKDSTGDLGRLVMQIRGDAPDFAVFSGNANLAFPALTMGAAGSITAFANVIPEIMVGLWDAIGKGDVGRAVELQGMITELHRAIGARGIPGIKTILAHRGFAPGDPRPPLQPLSPAAATEVIAAWEKAMTAAGW